MNPESKSLVLSSGLRRVRRIIIATRLIKTAIRWVLYASLILCLYLIISKIFYLDKSLGLLALFLPIIAVLVKLAQRFSLVDSAIYLDKTFGLEERLSTAVETFDKNKSTIFRDIQYRDAVNAFLYTNFGNLKHLKVKREFAYLVTSIIFTMVLLASPDLPQDGEIAKTQKLKEIAQIKAEKINAILQKHKIENPAPEDIKNIIPEVQDVVKELLKEKISPQEALERLKELLAKIKELESKFGEKDELNELMKNWLKELGEAIAGAGSSLRDELKKQNLLVEDPKELYKELAKNFPSIPKGQGDKIGGTINPSDQFAIGDFINNIPKEKGTVELILKREIADAIARHQWDAKYDFIVKKYYSSE